MNFNNQTLFSALSTAMELLSLHLTKDDYIVTPTYEKVNSYEKIVANYRKFGRLVVWSGAREHTLYDTPEANVSFRAVHGWIHIHFMLGFTPRDEEAVLCIQKRLVRSIVRDNPLAFSQYVAYEQSLEKLAEQLCRVMQADLNGTVAYEKKHGFYPLNQRLFVEDYLNNSIQALNTGYEAWKPT